MADAHDLQAAIRRIHGADSAPLFCYRLAEQHGNQSWQGDVSAFLLVGHPLASRCYAWEDDGEVYVVLHRPPIDSPWAAVRSVLARRQPRAGRREQHSSPSPHQAA